MNKSIIYFFTILLISCSQSNNDNQDTLQEKELELTKKELELKERELKLKEGELSKLQEAPVKDKTQTEEEIISDIREKFGAINYNINSYSVVKKPLMDKSTEGGEIQAFFKGEELKKVIVTYYFEMGKLIEEYYFWETNLFFIFKQEHSYNMPMYMEGSEVESVSEYRFYFDSDKLIRWLDPTKSKVAKSKFSST